MRKVIDIIGQKFGHLLVIARSTKKDKWGQTFWSCRCECGKISIVNKSNLISGSTKSCGCLKYQKAHNQYEDRIQALWLRIFNDRVRKRARQNNMSCHLQLKDFIHISTQPCVYCGIPFCHTQKDTDAKNANRFISNHVIYYNGLDRIDSSLGYTANNVQSCCEKCNYAKRMMNHNEFVEWINGVYRHVNKEKGV